jgi:hypothetical protein
LRRPTKNGKANRRSGTEQSNGAEEKSWNVPLTLDRDELMAMLQECLTDFATGVGLKVACLLFDKQADISCERTNSRENGSGRRRSVPHKKKRVNTT